MDSKGVQFLVFCVLAIVILGGVYVYFNPPRAFEPPQTTHTAKTDTQPTSPSKNSDLTRTNPADACPNPTTYYYDGDLDGYGVTGNSITGCNKPYALYAATKSGDCDDKNPKIHPNAIIIHELYDLERFCWNGIDEDCDGQDESCLRRTLWSCHPDSPKGTMKWCIPGSEDQLCYDEIDDDNDGLTDCDDPDCSIAYECGYRVAVDVKGEMPYFPGERIAIQHGDGTDDHRDDDGDGYCETLPCTSSADPSLKLEELQGGDCNDNPFYRIATAFQRMMLPCRHGPKGCIFHTGDGAFVTNPGALEHLPDDGYGNHVDKFGIRRFPDVDENCDGIIE